MLFHLPMISGTWFTYVLELTSFVWYFFFILVHICLFNLHKRTFRIYVHFSLVFVSLEKTLSPAHPFRNVMTVFTKDLFYIFTMSLCSKTFVKCLFASCNVKRGYLRISRNGTCVLMVGINIRMSFSDSLLLLRSTINLLF